MLVVLLSDIHSNLVALDAVRDALPQHDELWCLGDTIGYGPRPNECIVAVRDAARYVLTGNHDLASLGEIPLDTFNPLARRANQWNDRQLLPELRAWLADKPAKLVPGPEATIAHASPRDPVWEYILDVLTAQENLAHFDTPICFVGHTHVPMIYGQHEDGRLDFRRGAPGELVQLRPGSRYIINPGSVGQPRDGEPRAAYAVWDTAAQTVRFERVAYDIAATQRQMREAELPDLLVQRLAFGR